MRRKNWCESEEVLFKVVYPYVSNQLLAERFGTTKKSIERKAMRLKIRKNKDISIKTRMESRSRNREIKKNHFYKNDVKMIFSPNHPRAIYDCVPEHILIVEKFLGRYLKDGEEIIPKDGDLANHSLYNLCLVDYTEEIINKKKEGASIQELMEQFDMRRGRLYRILRDNGCLRR